MLNNPLITILTPCYNTEKYMQRFIDCILAQTYNNIEIIFIDDGSTDRTKEIIYKNKEALEKKCTKFLYVYQDNCGLGGSINNGLKYVTGKYLTWPDYDDILYPDYLEKKVRFLEDNPDISLCFNPVDSVDENNLNTVIGKHERVPGDDSRIIEDYIYCKNVAFPPITSCINANDFWKINPKRDIYPSKEGQNWQMLLPMFYHYKVGYIQETLAKYVVRDDSHSHTHMAKFFKRQFGCILILLNTIKNINMPAKEKHDYYYLIIAHYSKLILREFFIRILFLRKIKYMIKNKTK